MKISHIIGIITIAVAIAIIIGTTGDAGSYVDFSQASTLEKDGDDSKVHVVGKIYKTASGEISGMEYTPELDANYFAFSLVDQKNKISKVVYNNPKPQDFERSEQIVVIGNMKNGVFMASQILMKCPSKYVEKEIKA